MVLALIVVAFAVTSFRLVTGAQTSTGRVTGVAVFAAVMVLLPWAGSG